MRRALLAYTSRRETRLQQTIFDLYGLTPDEVRLLRATASPRDPLTLVEEAARLLGPNAAKPSGA